VGQHQAGVVDGYTARHLPVELVYSQLFRQITDAVAAERQVKGWRREKTEALIARRFELLPKLSKRRRGST